MGGHSQGNSCVISVITREVAKRKHDKAIAASLKVLNHDIMRKGTKVARVKLLTQFLTSLVLDPLVQVQIIGI